MKHYVIKESFFSNKHSFGQFIRSLIAGGAASLVDISIFSTAVNIFQINYIISNTVSFIFGLTVNYLLNREWVFNKEVHNTKRDFLLFSLVGITGLILSNILLFTLIDLRLIYYVIDFPNDRLTNFASKALVILLVFIWNFTARKKFIFSEDI